MKNTLALALAGAALLLAAIPAAAHHSFSAEYDSTKAVTLTGKLIKMDWVNPHSWIHMEVAADAGKTDVWDVETGPPNTLYRNGWRRDSIKPGEEIVVQGTMARNSPRTINARTVRTPGGQTLLAGSSENAGGAQK